MIVDDWRVPAEGLKVARTRKSEVDRPSFGGAAIMNSVDDRRAVQRKADAQARRAALIASDFRL